LVVAKPACVEAVEALEAALEACVVAVPALVAALPADTPEAADERPAKVAAADASAARAVKRVISESVVELPPPPTPRNIVKLILLLLS
jgi:hypothetical protein